MGKILFTTAIMTAFFLAPFAVGTAFASLQITEILYDAQGDDTGREWIEIFNPGCEDVDLTKIKFSEGGSSHGIGTTTEKVFNSMSYAVLADNPTKFKIDFPTYDGLLFDSTFSLNNTGERLSLVMTDDTEIDFVNYTKPDGLVVDGRSLQKIGGLWVLGTSTPGVENAAVSNLECIVPLIIPPDPITPPVASTTQATSTTQASTSTNATTSTQIITKTVIKYVSLHSSSEDLSDYSGTTKLEISAGRERVGYTGTPIKFSAKNNTSKYSNCSYSWVYGDGTKDTGQSVSHAYKFHGDYNIILNAICGSESAVSRTKIKILKPEVNFNLIPSGDLEVSNFGKTEINIGDWVLQSSSTKFVFPEDTIISANGKMILSKEYSKINAAPISLLDPSQDTVFSLENNREEITVSTSTKIVSVEVSKEEAEKFAVVFLQNNKKENSGSFAVAKTQASPINNQDTKGQVSSTKSSGVATVLESTKSPETKGFWRNLFGLPAKGIKALAKVFYEVE
jgi:hypothetical protein